MASFKKRAPTTLTLIIFQLMHTVDSLPEYQSLGISELALEILMYDPQIILSHGSQYSRLVDN